MKIQIAGQIEAPPDIRMDQGFELQMSQGCVQLTTFRFSNQTPQTHGPVKTRVIRSGALVLVILTASLQRYDNEG